MIVNYREWIFEVDYQKTERTYKSLSLGSPESCGCGYCQNFSKQRDIIYPYEIRDLFENLGIDHKKESEIYEKYKSESGLHLYGGWFHFAGKIITGRNCKISISENSFTFAMTEITENFSIGFWEDSSLSPFEKGIQLVQVEFQTKIPWILETVVE